MGAMGTWAKGAVAGVVGTLAMDALWYRRYREGGGEQDFRSWEFTEADEIDEAGAPAQIAQKVSDVVDVDLPDERAGTINDLVHWVTGIGNGVGHALLHRDGNPLVGGALTGARAFATSYGVLGAMGLYKPIWEYDREVLRKDLGAHLVYGVATGLTHALLDGTGQRDDGEES